jgi:threonine dehydrogenase-like Zn-dependent dehydrogenase
MLATGAPPSGLFAVLVVAAVGAGVMVAVSTDPENQAFGRAMAFGIVGALIGSIGGSAINPLGKS